MTGCDSLYEHWDFRGEETNKTQVKVRCSDLMWRCAEFRESLLGARVHGPVVRALLHCEPEERQGLALLHIIISFK